jgi:diguanylate cyclase (GGDEF)-like protein
MAVTPTVETAYDAAVTMALPWVAGLLGVVAAVLGGTDGVLLTGTDRVVTVSAAAALLLGCAAVSALTTWRRVPDRWSQPIAAALLVAVAAQPVAASMLTGRAREAVALGVLAATAGAAVLSVRWLVGSLYVVWGGFTSAALLADLSRDWLPVGVALAFGTGLAVLVAALRRRSCRELAAARSAVEAAVVRDQLTGLANRRGLAMVGAQIVEHARRQGDAAHCIFIDVGGLRTVNEQAGHDAGDQVLVAVGEGLREVTRATDVVARWGGDEFCVVGPGPGMAPLELERRVRETVLLNPPVPAELWPVRISAGGSMLAPWDAGTLETLLGSADQELHLRRSLRREGTRPAPRAASAD